MAGLFSHRIGLLAQLGGAVPGPGPGVPEATDWRLYFPQGASSYIWLREVELRGTVDGPQLAIHGTTGTATASSAFSGYGADEAFNGTTAGNGWSTSSESVPGEWIAFAFDTAQSLAEVFIHAEPDQYQPPEITLQYHDGTAWVGVQTWSTPNAAWDAEIPSDAISLVLDIAPAVSGYTVTVPAANVGASLTGFPLMIDLSDMPASFWDDALANGGNVRVYASDGTTLIPHDLTYINVSRKLGRLFARTDLSASANTTVIVKLDDTATSALPATDANGRNAVWVDYEVVWVFPDTTNRTGTSYPQSGDIDDPSEWLQSERVDDTGYDRGVATDSTGRVILIDDNALKRYDASDLSTVLASNSDPLNANGAPGGSRLNDGTIIGDELFVPIHVYGSFRYNMYHIAVYDADTLGFKRHYDISADGLVGSKIAYDGADLWLTEASDTTLYRYSLTGSQLAGVALSQAVVNQSGITYVDGVFYISSDDGSDDIYEVETDGTVNGAVIHRRTPSWMSGISYDGSNIWHLDGVRDLIRYSRDAQKLDWLKVHYNAFYATIDPRSAVWTMSASIYWAVDSGDLQQAFLSYANGGSSGDRASYLYDDGPDVLGLWNSTDGWMYDSLNPVAYESWRGAVSHDGTSGRKIWRDGVLQASEVSSASKPAGAGTTAEFILNAAEYDNTADGAAYYQFVWLRHEVMSDAWMAAEADNMADPAAFYAITGA